MQHKFETKVYYCDTDAEGVVYYANYLKWFEIGRTQLLESQGIDLTKLRNEQGYVFPVKKMSVEYSLPAKLYEEVIVETELESFSGVRFPFKQKVIRKKDQALCVAAEIELVAVDKETLKPKKLRIL